MKNGWIKLHRQIKDSPYYKNGAAMQTWLECLLRAAHGEEKIYLKRQQRNLQRGQFPMGREEFGQSIGISGSTAWFWLQQFKADSMIDIETSSKGSIVTVLNWNEYQEVDSNFDSKKTASEQEKNINKNVKKDKNEKKSSSTKKGPRPEVDKIIKVMTECFGSLDDTQKNNRQYAWLLFKKSKENLDGCLALIRGASKHDWWQSRIKKVETVYRNAQLIAEALRTQQKKQETNFIPHI